MPLSPAPDSKSYKSAPRTSPPSLLSPIPQESPATPPDVPGCRSSAIASSTRSGHNPERRYAALLLRLRAPPLPSAARQPAIRRYGLASSSPARAFTVPTRFCRFLLSFRPQPFLRGAVKGAPRICRPNGPSSSIKSASRPRLALRNGICFPSFSNTASAVSCTSPARAIAPISSSKRIAVHPVLRRAQLRVQFPKRPARFPVAHPPLDRASVFFHLIRRTESLRHTLIRRAEIANPARLLAIRRIAKMPHQARHPALAALRVPDHRLNLRPLLLALRHIRIAPRRRATAQIVGRIHRRAAMRPQFLQRLREHFGPHPHLLLHQLERLRYRTKLCENLIEHSHFRIITLEEKIVRVAVRIRMHQDRPARLAIASRASNFLVIRLHTAWQRRYPSRSGHSIYRSPSRTQSSLRSLRACR